MAKLKTEYWPIERLLPYAQNARRHPPEQVAQIAASIKEFGFINPVIVDANDEIIAGHGRVLGAKHLSIPSVPVVQVKHLTEAQVKAFRIADNSIQLNSGWDPGILQSELALLEEMSFDLTPLGLDAIELPELADLETPAPVQRNRKKTTIFLSVDNEKAAAARDIVVKALNKAKIEHNL